MHTLLAWAQRPRRVWLALAALSFSLFVFGLFLQHAVGLNPCPMCIVQRYALIGVGLLALLLAALEAPRAHLWGGVLVVAVAGFGAFTAARQSWLQWFPPEVMSCGRDLYGMIESFPLRRVVPMIFRGTGDCSEVDWTFLGLTIANWSFLNFVLMLAVASVTAWAAFKR